MNQFSRLVIALSLAFTLAIGGAIGITQSSALYENVIVYEYADTRVDAYSTIYLSKGKNLKILQLTDTQVKYPYNDYEAVGGSNEKTALLIHRLIQAIDPDLVIFTGNLVMSQTVNNWPYVKVFAELLEELLVYWTIAFGNHDSEASYVFQHTVEDSIYGQETKEQIINRLKSYPHCLISKGDATGEDSGTGNHFINIREKKTEKLIYSLCIMDCVYQPMLDSTFHREKTPSQISWYKRHINSLSDIEYGENRKESETINSLLFANVPVPEIFLAYDKVISGTDEEILIHYGKIIEGSPLSEKHLSCSLFEEALSLGSTEAMFFGHYHDNDVFLTLSGIDLVFGQHSGFSHRYRVKMQQNGRRGYDYDLSDIFEHGDERGGTLITIHNKKSEPSYTIERILAKDTIVWDDLAIDYESIYQNLLLEENSSVVR